MIYRRTFRYNERKPTILRAQYLAQGNTARTLAASSQPQLRGSFA